MKKCIVLLCLMMSLALQAEQIPHLILNFDINKTLIASDKTENKSLEDVINELLSRKYSACWDETLLEPITFDAYIKTVIMPGEEHDIKLKMARLVYLTHFIDYLKEHSHSLYPIVLKEFREIVEILQGAHIFPSFYRLIAELDQKGISYTLFLRSFGKEVFEVKSEINSKLNQLFQVEGVFRKGVLYVNGQQSLSTPSSIYDFFNSKQHAAIHDDWHYWVEGEMNVEYGKPFYLNLDDLNILTLFFDDNIKVDSADKNIIAPLDSKTGEAISIPYLVESKQLISVDTLEAILNENYYIERVREALQEHQHLWSKRNKIINASNYNTAKRGS